MVIDRPLDIRNDLSPLSGIEEGAGQYGYLHALLFESFATQDSMDIVCNVVPLINAV